jgi:transposase
MSTSLLYHAWALRGYRHCRTDFRGGGIVFRIEPQAGQLRCGHCGGGQVMRQGKIPREFRATPIGGRPVTIKLDVPRLWCANCSKTRQIRLSFADERRRYTHAFERYALELCGQMTIAAVAMHLGVSWDVIKEIQKRHLQRRFKRIRLRNLTQIAIDEIAVGKGHRYLTLVLDLVSGAVVFIGQGKGADALSPFWKSLRASGAKVEAVASDMSAAYLLAIAENLPDAVHVLDRFHVMKLFNEKLSELRRQIQQQAQTKQHKQVIKGTRWLLLKNAENLNEQRNERQRLDEALALNEPLATGYYLKEELREFWCQGDQRAATWFLDDWIRRAEASGVAVLKKFANTLRLHRRSLLNWYVYRISTGPLEGTNNKIQTMKRQAYGYRDEEFFRLKIHAIHEATYALVG